MNCFLNSLPSKMPVTIITYIYCSPIYRKLAITFPRQELIVRYWHVYEATATDCVLHSALTSASFHANTLYNIFGEVKVGYKLFSLYKPVYCIIYNLTRLTVCSRIVSVVMCEKSNKNVQYFYRSWSKPYLFIIVLFILSLMLGFHCLVYWLENYFCFTYT